VKADFKFGSSPSHLINKEGDNNDSDLDNQDYRKRLRAENKAFQAKLYRHWSHAMLKALNRHIYLPTKYLRQRSESNALTMRIEKVNTGS
jgi:hypothetical protein